MSFTVKSNSELPCHENFRLASAESEFLIPRPSDNSLVCVCVGTTNKFEFYRLCPT